MCMFSNFLDPILNLIIGWKRGDRENEEEVATQEEVMANSAEELNIFLAVGIVRKDPLASPSARK